MALASHREVGRCEVIMLGRSTLAVACFCFLTSLAWAQPRSPAEQHVLPYSGEMPLCESRDVLAKIQSRFGKYWGSGLEMVAFETIHETSYRDAGIDVIPRRSCAAKVWLNTGEARQLVYTIGEDTGFAGGDYFGWLLGRGTDLFSHWGVTFCVAGLDRNLSYGRNCQLDPDCLGASGVIFIAPACACLFGFAVTCSDGAGARISARAF
jgi:hypothetical protein